MVTKHERKGHDCGGNGRFARPGRFTTYSLARTIRRRLPVITYSANRAALRDCASCPSEVPIVRIKQHSGVRVSQNKQPFPSLPHAIISSMCRATTQTITVTCPAPLSLKTLFSVSTHTRSMAAAQDKRTDGWASPVHFSSLRSPICCEIPVLGSRGRTTSVQTVSSKEEPKSENVAPARTVDKVDKEDERRRNAVSATKRIGDSTEHDQAGVNRDQIYSHSNNEFCDGRELAAAVAFHPRKILARSPEASAQYPADLSADQGAESEVASPFPDCRSGTTAGSNQIHLPGHERPRQELQCRNGDPAALKGATDHGLMLRMVQKHGGQQVIHESVAQLRHLDRAACVLCDTIGSRRCHRCSQCEGLRHSEISLLVISSKAVDNLDTRMQRPRARPPNTKLFHSSQPVPPPRRQPASKLPHSRHRCHRTRQAATCRSSQSLGNGHPTLHSLSLCPSLGRKP